MQELCRVCAVWKEPKAIEGYQRGVSLHSHTSASEESLTFIHQMFDGVIGLRQLFRYWDKQCVARRGYGMDFVRGNWRPPLQPRMAFELESKQITDMGLQAMVSISDHDTIEAPMLLRTLDESRGIPMSVEWTAPFGETVFHLGIHNLPSADAADWMTQLAQFTAASSDAQLGALLRELDAIPQVLIVFNHPLWDLYNTGATHRKELNRFLAEHGASVHALELNGLRHPCENREVMELAEKWNQILISGGDRHGLEPNALINLTNATTFTEFVREIRVERRSTVLYLEQYQKPWEHRILASTLDAVSNHAHFAPGWQRWDERAFHADKTGEMRPLSELWAKGRAPLPLLLAIAVVRVLRWKTMGRALSLAFGHVNRAEVGEQI